MQEQEETGRSGAFYAVSYHQDIPTMTPGQFIPASVKHKSRRAGHVNVGSLRVYEYALVPALALLLVLGASLFGYRAIAPSLQVAAAPAVTIMNPYTKEETPLTYGVSVALSQPNFYAETRSAFIDSATTFIDVDLQAMELRYFKEGVLVESMPIEFKGQPDTWWQTPAGLYKIESKKENHFSSFGQVYQPWSMAFQGNFYIHGWPYHPGGEPVAEDFQGGCIRLSDANAKELFAQVKVGTPVLVYEEELEPQTFLYEPKVPELQTKHYLIADVDASTVLAGNALSEKAPIASITKLMTALITTEFINLDHTVSYATTTLIESVIPRLGDRSQVSVYALLRLLLLESSNEAAEVLAEQIGRERFVEEMNKKAKALGMNDTNFADPSGQSKENVSTVSDLLRLIQYIRTHRSFVLELTADKNLPATRDQNEFGPLSNFNDVADDENFIGGKIGETTEAGQTSVSLHRFMARGEERVLAIILLGSTNRTSDVKMLLQYAEERFGE